MHGRCRRLRRLTAVCLLAGFAACAGEREPPSRPALEDGTLDIAATRRALVALFLEYEHPRQLVVWDGATGAGPIFAALGLAHFARRVDVAALGLPVPVSLYGADSVQRLFRAHPDGWAEFYRRFEGASGLIEVGLLHRSKNGRSASLMVGRSFGEHCRTAWRVTLDLENATSWRVSSISAVRVPDG